MRARGARRRWSPRLSAVVVCGRAELARVMRLLWGLLVTAWRGEARPLCGCSTGPAFVTIQTCRAKGAVGKGAVGRGGCICSMR